MKVLERRTGVRLGDAERIRYPERLAFRGGDRMRLDVQRLQMGANARDILRGLHLPTDAPQPDRVRLMQHDVVMALAAAEQVFAVQRLPRRRQADEVAIEIAGALDVGDVQRDIAQASISKILRHACLLRE